jgi:hydrogenase maturation protease
LLVAGLHLDEQSRLEWEFACMSQDTSQVEVPVHRPEAGFSDSAPTLILGIGNILLRDEGVGVRVIEAIEAQAAPGTVFRLRGDELMPNPGVAVSLHQLGLVESLTMAEQLECAPTEVIIFGVQPDQIRPGLELSALVANAVPGVIDAVLKEASRSSRTSRD